MRIIEERIKTISDVAKVQEIGKDPKGKPRYMIYITGSAKELGLTKGDKVTYSISKLREGEPTVRIRRPDAKPLFGKKREPEVEPTRENTSPINPTENHMEEPNEAEQDFIDQIKKITDPGRLEFLTLRGENLFGSKRVRELIELSKK